MNGHAPERPGILGYILAGCLPAVAIACTLTAAVYFLVTGTDTLGSIPGADGSVTLNIPAAGDYHCYAEGDGFRPAPGRLQTMSLRVTSATGGSATVSSVGASITYDLQGKQGVAVRTLTFAAPGTYTVQTQWEGEPPDATQVSRLTFGQLKLLELGLSIMGGCCGSGLAIVVAIILGVITYKRRSDWDQSFGPNAYPSEVPGIAEASMTPPTPDWPAPPGPAEEPPDPYRPPLDDPPPPNEDRLY